MSPLGKFSLRLGLYGAVFLYLAGDLFLFDGPLRQRLDRADPSSAEAIAAAKQRGVVARVFNHQITRSQLERALHERLWLEGKSPADLTPANLKTARYAALDDLLDHELLRIKSKANANQLKVETAEIDARLDAMRTRFESRDEWLAAMKSQGIPDETAMRDRLAARIQQEKYVELKAGPLAAVTPEEARDWFEKNRAQLGFPERIEARHIFIPTLGESADEAKAKLEAAHAELAAGTKDFETLAGELSRDPASRGKGGRLGWMTRDRLPVDFATPVFDLPLNQPSLIRTKLGWHLVEVTGRKPAAERPFEEVEPEVRAALENAKRQKAANEFRLALRQMEAHKIDVFHDMIQ
jgi:parvulin-like peptidyl-prolyl isomerase